MTDRLWTRRGLLAKGATAAGGLVIAAALPTRAEAAAHNAACHAQFGPLHRYLWATGPDPLWQDTVIWRESNWEPSATNPSSGAAGLAQFMPYIWSWIVDVGMAAGSPYDPYAAIDAMNACLRRGWFWMWSETGY